MAPGDLLNRSLDAGKDATQKTQEALEALVRDLARNVEEQANQVQELVSELVERGRATSEQVVESVDRELRDQLASIASLSKANLARLEDLTGLSLSGAGLKKPPAKKKAAAKIAPAKKKAPAKKAPAKKKAAAAKKKAAAKKAPATRKAAAKKAPAAGAGGA